MAGQGDQSAVARVYARALLDLARESGKADELLEEIQALAKLVRETPDLDSYFASLMIDSRKRADSLEKMLRGRISDLLLDTLQVLNRRDRLGMVESVAEQYRVAYQLVGGRVDVAITTAVPLDDPTRERIRAAAKHYTGRDPDLVETVDPGILGGMIVLIGDRKFDSSLTTGIRRLSERLAERASREIHAGHGFVS